MSIISIHFNDTLLSVAAALSEVPPPTVGGAAKHFKSLKANQRPHSYLSGVVLFLTSKKRSALLIRLGGSMHFIQHLVDKRVIIDLRFAIVIPRFAPRVYFVCKHYGVTRYVYRVERCSLKIYADHPKQQVCARCLIGELKKSLARCPRCHRYIVPLRLLDAPAVKISDLWGISPEEARRVIAEEHGCNPQDYK